SVRQDGALSFGQQITVNAVDPSSVARLLRYDWKSGGLNGLANGGAIVDDGFARKHHLTVGSPLDVTSVKGVRLHLVVRGIEGEKGIDALGLGPVTIAQATYARAFDQPRNRLTLVDGRLDSVRHALAGFPEVKVSSKAAFVDDQTAWIGQV